MRIFAVVTALAGIATVASAISRDTLESDLKALERDAALLGVSSRSYDDSRCDALSGVCRSSSAGPCASGFVSGKCGGGSERRCCPNEANSGGNSNNYDDSRCHAISGVCRSSGPCASGFVSGKCGGGSERRCCPNASSNNGNNNGNDNSGNNGGNNGGSMVLDENAGGTSTWTGPARPSTSHKCGAHLNGICQQSGSACQGEFRSGFCPGNSVCCAPLEKNLRGRNFGSRQVVARAGSHNVYRAASKGGTLFFKGNMDADADGMPNAYCPGNRGLDSLSNGGMKSDGYCPGKSKTCYGMAFAPSSGRLCLQGAGDPNPGCYVSVTAVAKSWRKVDSVICDPTNYADSGKNPYFVIPRRTNSGMSKKDLGLVYDTVTRRALFSWVADIGPAAHTGEASIATLLAFNYSPFKNGKIRCGAPGNSRFIYVVFAGTRASSGFIDNFAEVKRRGMIAFNNWGGMRALEALTGHTGITFIDSIPSIGSIPEHYKSNGCRFMN